MFFLEVGAVGYSKVAVEILEKHGKISEQNLPTQLVGAGRAMGLSKLCCHANSFARGGGRLFFRACAAMVGLQGHW